MDELKDFKKLMNKARTLSVKQSELMDSIYGLLEDLGVDIEAPSNAENAEDIQGAIGCFIAYGEYNVDAIIEEIKGNLAIKE